MLRSAACGVNTSSSPISFSSVTRPDLCGKLGSYGLSGSYSFSMAMTTVAAEAKPKAMGVFNSKNIVLYQYEACPFCNKVRGKPSFFSLLLF